MRTWATPQAQHLLDEDFQDVLRTPESPDVIVVDDPAAAAAAAAIVI